MVTKQQKMQNLELKQYVIGVINDMERDAVARGTTLKQAAAKCGVGIATIYRWKAGTQEPTIYTLHRLRMAIEEESV